jgi:hypothetical protein
MLHGLTKSEVDILQDAINRINNLRENEVTRLTSSEKFTQEEDHQAPEFYIAYTENGIEAIDTTVDPPTVSTDDCDIYQPVYNGTNWEIQTTEGTAQVTVLNTSETDVDAGTYILITREKYGQWVVITGGGGPDIFEFTIDSVDCTEESAEVTAVTASCGGSLPTGSPLKVYDDLGCMLAFPEVQLIGANGYAVKMDGPGRGDPSTTACHWAILTLCGSVQC